MKQSKSKKRGESHFLNIVFIFSLLLILFLTLSVVTKKDPLNFFSFAQDTDLVEGIESQEGAPYISHGPLVGGVTDNSAVVWVRAPLDEVLGNTQSENSFFVRISDSVESLNAAKSVSTPQVVNVIASVFNKAQYVSPQELPWDNTWKATVMGLTPNTTYYIDVFLNGKSLLSVPYPRFKTFVPKGQSANFKFGVLTDFGSVHSNNTNQDPIPVRTFTKMDQENTPVDFVVIGGDLWHTDTDPTQGKRDMYKGMYSLQSPIGPYNKFVKRILRKYSLVHFWDDHDIGLNNADKNYKNKEQSYQVLSEFFPVYSLSQNPSGQNGDWQKFSYAQVDFFVLDGRSQRDNVNDPDNEQKSMLDGDNLGAKGQLQWLLDGLNSSTAKWKIIFSPLVFNPTMTKSDAWFGYKNERSKIIKFIKNNNIKGVVIVSGDAHGGGIDDGTNSGVPEMLVPGPNMKLSCFTSSNTGKWSHGVYGQVANVGCRGYGLVRVLTNPDRIVFIVKDDNGNKKLKLRYFLNQAEAKKYANLPEDE